MGKVKYSKKTTPPPISSSLRLKKSVCVILPRVDVTEFLRERRRRSLTLQQSAPAPNGGSPSVASVSVVPSGSVRVTKRRFRIKKEPPCIFHSQVDITDNNVEEIPGVLDQSIQSDSLCIHEITKSMCYMCSPRATVEDKSQVWDEINDTTTQTSSEYRGWHVPTPFAPSTFSSGHREEANLTDDTQQQEMQSEASPQFEPNNTTEIGVGTGNDLIASTNSRDQSTQTVRYFHCKHCLALFTDVAHLIHHKTVHQKMFECPFCTANFISKNDLKSHLKLHMLPKYYDCVYCNQAFTKKHDIREHLALHAEQKQFRCQQCPARFPQKNNLRNHEQSHNVSKFIHVFKKIDDNEPLSGPKKGRRSAGSISNSDIAGTSAASNSPGKAAKSPRQLVSGTQRITPTSTITPTPNMFRPTSSSVRTSYLALSSISDTPLTPNNTSVTSSSTSAGPTSVSTFTNTETPIVPEPEIQTTRNFFQCQFCPLSSKNYQAFKAHIVCHTRKKGKFNCTSCGGNFMKKSGLWFHMKHSHTMA